MPSSSILTVVALLGLAPGQAPEQSQVVVLPLVGDAGPEVRAEVTGLVRAEATRLLGSAVLDGDHTDDELASAGNMGLDCAPDDEGCLARLAILMRAERLVAGSVALQKSGDMRLRLTVISASSASRINEVDEQVAAAGPARLQGIRTAVSLLLAPERMLGTIRVAAGPAGATVLLDGAPVGTLPFDAPLSGVRVGRHLVRIQKDGFTSEERVVDVFAGTETLVEAQLTDAPSPSPDEDVALADDAVGAAPVEAGGNVVGLSLLIAGGVGLILGGGVTVAAGAVWISTDQVLWWTPVGDVGLRNAMFLASKGFAVAAGVALIVALIGGATAGVGLVVGGLE